MTLSSTSYTYTGKAKTPMPTVRVNGTKLTKGTDYTVSYSNNTKAGTATVKITGCGDYSGTKSVTFTINPLSIKTSSSAYVSRKLSSTSYTYSSSTKSKTITGLKSGKTYQVQVRAYKSANGTKYYGSWSRR